MLGHGIDLVDTARIQGMLDAHGDRFLKRCFSEAEIAYAQANPRRRVEHLAGRFAAKEAIYKALGTGRSAGIRWTDAEVRRESSGQPVVMLSGRAEEIAAERGIRRWWLSISHVETYAMASAIAEG